MLASARDRQDIGENVLSRTFRTARKRRIALALCDQVPSEVDPAILGNLGCRVVMRLTHAKCIWSIQSSMCLRREQAEMLTELRPRQAVVQYPLHPRPLLIEVPEVSFPAVPGPAALAHHAEELLAHVHFTTSTPAAGAKGTAPTIRLGDLSGDAMQVMRRICEQTAESIDERCQTLRFDRAREFRARAELDEPGFIEQLAQTIGGKVKFFQSTRKGADWAKKQGIHIKTYKSGIVHEYLLCQVERRIGSCGSNWRLQRHSAIARDQGLQPDLLAMSPDGRRIIVEIVCNNIEYDAENIIIEAGIPEVDTAIAVTPDKKTLQALEKALQSHLPSEDGLWQAKVRTFDAVRCLGEKFDWRVVLVRPDGGS